MKKETKLLPEGIYQAILVEITSYLQGYLALWKLKGHNQEISDPIFTKRKDDFYGKHSTGSTADLLIKQVLSHNGCIINSIALIFWT